MKVLKRYIVVRNQHRYNWHTNKAHNVMSVTIRARVKDLAWNEFAIPITINVPEFSVAEDVAIDITLPALQIGDVIANDVLGADS